MNALRSIPIPTKEGVRGWVVGLVTGERVFVKANNYWQDDTSICFHNGADQSLWGDKDLVLQIEKIHMTWFMPNDDKLDVLIATAQEEDDNESED